jgi:hypothetical protein
MMMAPDEKAAFDEISAKLNDRKWRLTSGQLYKIIVKGDDDEDGDGLVLPFIPNRAQRRFMARMHNRNVILKARQLGFCLDPATRVLTADLRWIAISDLAEGDEVVAVDEYASGGKGQARRMRTATVQAAVKVERQAYRITFDDGRSVVCTGQHPWLSRKAGTESTWRAIEERDGLIGRLKVGTLVRWVAKPWENPTVEDGWFGGMLDGEGAMSKRNSSAGINVSQREGRVWDRLVSYCEKRGYSHCIESDKAERLSKYGKVPVPKIAFGRMDEMFRVIGQTRPTRFIGNRFWEGRELPGKRDSGTGWARIEKIELLGVQPMVDLQTSTGTYIAEGFVSHNTTVIAIMWLDTALFSLDPIRCGIIAQDKETAESIFRDKVKFAYDHLPDWVREMLPLKRDTMKELVFAKNGSSIRVATSVRGGTIHRLHISEFGKICAKAPDKAKEIVTGSIPAVPKSGMLIIESTAEGQEGEFYKITQRAQALHEKGDVLTQKDYRFHFFPWWEAPEYELDPESVVFTEADNKYFIEIEAQIHRELSLDKRAWYVATRNSDFSGDPTLMWQEYPSTPKEAFQVSTEGCYYSTQLALARKQGRVLKTIPMVSSPVNTFWDLGRGDMTSVWFHQRVGPENRFIRYYENSGEEVDHYVKYLQGLGFIWGKHYLPHEADYKRLGETPDLNLSIKEMFERQMPGAKFEIVPRITNINFGIGSTRNVFSSCWFAEDGCADGLARLGGYKKEWNKMTGSWKDNPLHDANSHGADAFRQFGQVADAGESFASGGLQSAAGNRFKRKGSPMSV